MSKSGVLVHGSFRQRMGHVVQAIAKLGYYAATGSTGQWEGYELGRSRRRPSARKVSQDTDLDYGIRENLLAEARSLCQVFGIPNRILRQFANYVVGDCCAQWNTGDKQWDETTEEAFENWSKLCDVGGRHNLRSLARLGVISAKRDGDVFYREIDEEGFYQLEAIEGDRVGNYRGSSVNIDDEKIVGGVILDARNRPNAYRVHGRDRYGNFLFQMDAPASETIHLYDPMRIDACRGVTALHAALNRLRDMKETISAQQGAQKLASKLSLIFKTGQGGAAAFGINPLGDDSTNNGTSIKTEEVSDMAIQYMFTGEDVSTLKNDMPADSWFNFMEFLIRDIAIGVDLPFEFVWNMAGLPGPAVRMMSKQAERTFKNEQDNLEDRFLDRVGARWITKEMDSGRIPFNANWYKFKFPRPAHPSIDAGRDTTSDMAEYDAGTVTRREIIEARAGNADDVDQRRFDEADALLERAQILAKKRDVPISTALELLGRPNSKQSMASVQAQTAEGQADASSNTPTPKAPNKTRFQLLRDGRGAPIGFEKELV